LSERLLLIDGFSLIHRAYHALPPLSTAEGQPTNAVFGLAQMLLSLLETEQPTAVAVALDLPGPTFRHELTDTYKANRAEMDEELAAQIGLAKELLAALGLAQVEVAGFEADDVIGTLATQARERGEEVVIVSGDRDLLQLVEPGISVVATLKGLSDTRRYDAEAVREQYGVGPEQISDWKALAGDATDNIPGVAGIGPKGAASLLTEFGSLAELLGRLEEVSRESLRTKLQDQAALVGLWKELATIRRDVPLPLGWGELAYAGPDRRAARKLFARLEFGNLLERTGQWGSDWEGEVRLATESDLEALCREARAAGHLTVAPCREGETGAALAVSAGAEVAWVWPLGSTLDGGQADLFSEPVAGLPECLRQALGEAGLPKWGCRLKEVAGLLAAQGARLAGSALDAEVADYLLAPQRSDHRIMLSAARELGWWLADDSHSSQPLAAGQLAAGVECLAVERLHDSLQAALQEQGAGGLFTDLEMPLVEVLAAMEQRGIGVDLQRLQAIGRELGTAMEGAREEVQELAGESFNLDSPKQVGEVFFGKLGLPGGRKTKTGWATGAEVLEELAGEHRIVARLLEYRELAKLKSTYVEGLQRELNPATGRVHTTFEQTVTATGRLSSRNPNLQNIPIRTELGREIRSCFVAAPGWRLIKADYSQIELRLLAHFSADPHLVAAFRAGEDIHRRTAALIAGCEPEAVTGEMRRAAKTVNFAVLYGMGAPALGKLLGISRAEAQSFIEQYFKTFGSVQAYLEGLVEEGRQRGYVETLLGRRRPVPDLHSPSRNVQAYAERAAANTPLQGSAADLVKLAMVQLAREIEVKFPAAGILLQVHDELVLEAPEEWAEEVGAITRNIMEQVAELSVPLAVEVGLGQNWRDMQSLPV
jgi:DNA polymerase-1